MKHFLLTLSLMFHVAAAWAQQPTKFDVDYSNRTIIQALTDLRGRTGHTFVYRDGVIPSGAGANYTARGVTLREILDGLLKGNGYDYTIEGRVVLVERTAPRVAMPMVVTGRVLDSHGAPLAGASVTLASNRANGTHTDTSGTFSLRVPATGDIMLQVSFMGYKSVDVRWMGQPLRVVLSEAAIETDRVVVTGIFERPRESYTGAVTQIRGEQLQTYRGQNLIQTLGNIDPSLNILSDNINGSNPNVLPELTIRGRSSLPLSVQELNEGQKNNINTPLIIMDGFEISLQKLMDYNDQEILSINILKDASATAIYGSRGANGVIVIVSKQPVPGQMRVNFSAGADVEMPDLSSYDLLNAAEKLKLEWDNGFYQNAAPSADLQFKRVYYRRLRDVEEGVDTYWLAKPLRTGISSRYNLRLDGGSDEFRWGVVAGYNRVSGAMKNSGRNTFTGQVILQYNYKNITLRNQSEVTTNKARESNYGSFDAYVRMNPYYAPWDAGGNLVRNFENLSGAMNVGNPLYDASLASLNKSGYLQLINNFSVDWKITEGLTLRGKFGLQTQRSTSDVFVSPLHSKFLSEPYYTSGDGVLERGRYTYTPGQNDSFDAGMTLAYTRTLGEKHQLYAGLDYTMLQRKSNTLVFEAVGFNNENLNSIGNAMRYALNTRPQESDDFTRSLGVTSNVNYTFDNRYYADLSLRVDGSSQFGSQNRFAPFWSAGLGWNVHNEAFLKGGTPINNLRLRLSYGKTGMQQFSAYQAMSTFRYYTNDRYANWGGAYLDGFGNKDLKWQVTGQANVGFEVGAWQNRLTAAADFYVKRTSNLLSNIDIPHSTGFKSYIANVGEVKNVGFEASLGGILLNTGKLSWMMTAKLAHNKDHIVSLSDDIKRQTEEYLQQDVDVSTLFYEGRSQNSLYVVQSLGIDPSTGREEFIDRNGNQTHTWSPADKVYAGVLEPTCRGNLSTMLRYGNLTLTLSFAGHWGGVVYNSTLAERVELMRSSIAEQNVDRRVLADRWSKPGDVAMFKKIPAEGETDAATRGTSRFVMRDRVFQMQTANLDYHIDGEWLRKAGVSSARVSVNMSDIFYLSSVRRERGTGYPFTRRAGATVSLMF